MNTGELIHVFESTQEMINSDAALLRATQRSREESRTYGAGFQAQTRAVKSCARNVSVTAGTSFDTARALASGRTAVLNFANPYDPGGGVRGGVVAQEECLCRCSNLYNVLTAPALAESYYRAHRQEGGYLFSDRVIYSPDIRILRSDGYELLDRPFAVDVITCAAPYNVGRNEVTLLKAAYASRIRNILEVAIDRGADTVVLGAFGCGVFRNPPERMAAAFGEILLQEAYFRFFERVIFAIPDLGRSAQTLAIFRRVLAEESDV